MKCKKPFLLGALVFFIGILSAAKVVTFPELTKPDSIVLDKDRIYITQFPNILLYSSTDFKFIKKIGKAGEGPQEFSQYVRVLIPQDTPGNIWIGSQMKMSLYTRDGDFVKEIKAQISSVNNVYNPMGKKFVTYRYIFVEGVIFNTVDIYDSNLKRLKEVRRWKRPLQPKKPYNATNLQGGEFAIYDQKLFVLLNEEGNIEVFDDDGKKLYTMNYNYERIPVTPEEEKKYHHFYKTDPRYREVYDIIKMGMRFPKFYPAARTFQVDDNKIYVMTNKREDKKSQFVIFDIKGKFLKKLMLPFRYENIQEPYPFIIKYGKLFQLVDNEDTEQWELHITNIE